MNAQQIKQVKLLKREPESDVLRAAVKYLCEINSLAADANLRVVSAVEFRTLQRAGLVANFLPCYDVRPDEAGIIHDAAFEGMDRTWGNVLRTIEDYKAGATYREVVEVEHSEYRISDKTALLFANTYCRMRSLDLTTVLTLKATQEAMLMVISETDFQTACPFTFEAISDTLEQCYSKNTTGEVLLALNFLVLFLTAYNQQAAEREGIE
jgi:hypothetical protein